jgi:hypothetical protein
MIVYQYNQNNGGIADFIKFFLHTLDVCETNNINNLYIDINHPIKQYININKKYIISKRLIINFYNISNLDKNCNIKDLLKRNNLILKPIDFYSFNINFELHNDIDFNNNIHKKYNIYDYFNFTDLIYERLNNYNYNYNCIHIRMGDKFLEIKPSSSYCKNDNRNINIDNILSIINKININDHLYLFSDNNEIKKIIINKYKNINTFYNDIINISNDYNNAINYNEALINVIFEMNQFYH